MKFDETGHKDHIATTKFSNSILHNSPVQFFSLYFSLPIMHSGNFVPKYSKRKINCDYFFFDTRELVVKSESCNI